VRLDLPPEVEAAHLDELRGRFDAGDKAALLSAIGFCFDQQIVAPDWIVAAFFRAMNRWYAMEVKELGEAFGLEWPKGKHPSAAKKMRRLSTAVYLKVHEAQHAGRALDDDLFAEIGEQLGLGKTLVKDYYKRGRFRMPKSVELLLDSHKSRREK
jgi:hypothetical protein